MSDLEQRVAVKAVIVDAQGRVLVLRKGQNEERNAGQSGRYDLPGGKIAPGESIRDALAREVREEAGLILGQVDPRPLLAGEWRPVIQSVEYQIFGVYFMCKEWTGTVTLGSEHSEHAWITLEQLQDYDIVPPEDQAIRVALAE